MAIANDNNIDNIIGKPIDSVVNGRHGSVKISNNRTASSSKIMLLSVPDYYEQHFERTIDSTIDSTIDITFDITFDRTINRTIGSIIGSTFDTNRYNMEMIAFCC